MPDVKPIDTVEVTIDGTGGGGYHYVINVPAPDLDEWIDFEGAEEEWWQDVVFPHTGSGKGGHDYVEAKITSAPNLPTLVGQSTSWEG